MRVPLVGGASIVDSVFVARPNRFVVAAQLPTGEQVLAHCADRGRLLWLQPGTPLLLGVKSGAGRKTGFQVAAAQVNGAWASLDTHLPNRLIAQALRMKALAPFTDYTTIRPEARHGVSRFDFRLSDAERVCYVEVKSVGIVHDGVALFPDAPTERGRRHVQELAALHAAGIRTALVFVAQHAHAQAVAPDRMLDPLFADALVEAERAGVEIYAWRCPIQRHGITIDARIPVLRT
jgi:sugar fermentation stimulation protein A